MSESQPIRQEGITFIGEKDKYLQKLAQAKLPIELEHLRHQIPWPLDMTDPRVHLALFYGDKDFTDPEHLRLHKGIDVQLPKETVIFALEPGRVAKVDPENYPTGGLRRQLTDITFFGDSGLVYHLCHIYTPSVPENLMKTYRRRLRDLEARRGIMNREVTVNQGDYLGTVGIFYNRFNAKRGFSSLPQEVIVPADVRKVYGRSYNHLHIEIITTPAERYWYDRLRAKLTDVNPLPLLQKLY